MGFTHTGPLTRCVETDDHCFDVRVVVGLDELVTHHSARNLLHPAASRASLMAEKPAVMPNAFHQE